MISRVGCITHLIIIAGLNILNSLNYLFCNSPTLTSITYVIVETSRRCKLQLFVSTIDVFEYKKKQHLFIHKAKQIYLD